MTKIKDHSKEKTFEVTTNFADALISLREDKDLLDLLKKAESSFLNERIINSIIRDSFVVRLLSFENREDFKLTAGKGDYSSATVFELLPFLHEFPEFKKFNILAEGSWHSETSGDVFNITNKAGKDGEGIVLRYKCFNSCCTEKRVKEDYYILELKN